MELFKIQLAFVLLASLSNSMILSQISPYLGFMVDYFQLAERSSSGYYAGWLTFAVMIGRTISSPFWGWVIDRWGRKPTLVSSLYMVGLASLGLGFSGNIGWAVFFRFSTGFFNSLLITTKTLVSEVCPEHYHAQGMSWLSLTRHIGTIIGTAAGMLAGQHGWYFFDSYPFLLPNLITALCCFICAIGIQENVTETLHTGNPDLLSPLSKTQSPEQNNYWELLKDRTVMTIVGIYGISCVVSSAIMDLIPVWCWAKVENGGLEFDVKTIGATIIISNTMMAVVQQFMFAPLVAAKGYIWVRLCGSLCLIPATLFLPCVHSFVGSPGLLWTVLLISLSIWYLFMFQVLTVEFILINNSVTKKQRGKANGVAMSLGSVSRAVGSPMATMLFALTATSGWNFPLDFTCAFTLNAGLCLLTYFLTFLLPATIERPKDVIVKEK